MPHYTSLTNLCCFKPSFQLMASAYQDYLTDSAPCKADIKNQCAVRMSVALERCGFSLDAFDPPNRVHRGRRSCELAVPHVVGAHELAKYLKKIWGETQRFHGSTVDSASADLGGRPGVIYFNNCFRREAAGPSTGDHIDLWDGEHYYNQIIRVGAGGDAGVRAPLFERADAVWFFELAS